MLTTEEAHLARNAPAGMTWVAGGTFTMGSEHFYPEEAPLRRVSVDAFWIDTAPVTNREFASVVDMTGINVRAS